ncbi:MAG TPA: hypothetical protein VLB12_00760 [Gemmatimonadales bacterium]|nr:hypothetical protein [Gemmatimonadales bacterium]
MDGMLPKLRLWGGLTSGVLLLFLAGVGCPRPEEDLGAAYDCPDHDVKLPPINTGDTAWSQVPLAGVITPIAEFHDCQRLISLSDSTKYGPLVGIWVSEVLDRLPDSLARLRSLIKEKEQRRSIVGNIQGPIPNPLQAIGTGLPFAEILAWPEPKGIPPGYRPLGIERGWNCLYLFNAMPSGLTARMVPVTDPNTCTKPVLADTLTSGKPLNVAMVSSSLAVGSYPPVGRWEWDGRTHYIGMGCHTAWCEVTDRSGTDFHSSKHYSLPAAVAADLQRRVFEVKGWYDEQRLAVFPNSGEISPASFRGTVVPDPGLDAIPSVAAFKAVWVPVAQIALDRKSEDYRKKLNLHPGKLPLGSPPESMTQVYLCANDSNTCFPEGGAPTCDFRDSDGKWWAKIVAPDGHVEYRCGRRVDHSGLTDVSGNPIHIPGAARWKWSNHDEQLWVRCGEGCCAVH